MNAKSVFYGGAADRCCGSRSRTLDPKATKAASEKGTKFNRYRMIFTSLALVSALVVSPAAAFAPHFSATYRVPTSLDYSVGIVGATGAVGKEIRQCLETRGKLQVDQLRIFGSERSAGTQVETKYGDVMVELFSVDAARQCDVVFLAVDGDFALEHAKNICEGDDGAVVIDNSVGSKYSSSNDVEILYHL